MWTRGVDHIIYRFAHPCHRREIVYELYGVENRFGHLYVLSYQFHIFPTNQRDISSSSRASSDSNHRSWWVHQCRNSTYQPCKLKWNNCTTQWLSSDHEIESDDSLMCWLETQLPCRSLSCDRFQLNWPSQVLWAVLQAQRPSNAGQRRWQRRQTSELWMYRWRERDIEWQ